MESDIGRWKCVVTGKNGGEWETGVSSFRVKIAEDLQCKFLKLGAIHKPCGQKFGHS